jgi:integrase
MATVCVKILPHHLKADGTFNVKIRITLNKVKRYIDTEHFVTAKQLTKKLTLKDPFIEQNLNTLLINYRLEISKLGDKLPYMTADQLRDHLAGKDESINFIAFCDEHIKSLRKNNRAGSAANHQTVRNSLVDYFQRENVSVQEITSAMLANYEKYLYTERTIKRTNQLKKEVTTIEKGISAGSLYNYMRDLRTLFNAARTKYNDEEIGIIRIPHYPFKKYKVGTPPATAKRNLKPVDLSKLFNAEPVPNSRAELAKDLFTLSFLLCGINATDLYQCSAENIVGGRLEYNRSKTKRKRKDNAFISIKNPKEAEKLLNKYLGHLPERYASVSGLDGALSKGMHQLCKIAELTNVTFYWARHSFANIARNRCRYSKDDIALALNHVDDGNRVTDIYIDKDWSIIDEVQAAVIAVVYPAKVKPARRAAKAQRTILPLKTDEECIVRQLQPRLVN